MLSKIVGLSFFFLISACAAANQNLGSIHMTMAASQPRLFVGHGTSGEIVVAATHYDAMNGLAVSESDLGLPDSGNGDMLCERSMPTGTHVPHWICRYKKAASLNRELVHNDLSQPRVSFDRPMPQAAMVLGIAGGPSGGGGVAGHNGTLPR